MNVIKVVVIASSALPWCRERTFLTGKVDGGLFGQAAKLQGFDKASQRDSLTCMWWPPV
jgi:hypothetical protein